MDAPKPRRATRRLGERGVSVLKCLFFTHGHRDHLPELSKVTSFVAQWLKSKSIDYICLPSEAIEGKFALTDSVGNEDPKMARLRDALDHLEQWHRIGKLRVVRAEQGHAPFEFGDVTFRMLHPSFVFGERHRQTKPKRINETSLVLKVEYGSFAALLLADLEKDGLAELIESVSGEALRCNVLKIPHHGAWKRSSERDFQSLMNSADPAVAILSVGSRNQHGHVSPELFRELLDRKLNNDWRLQSFICTELTRTCVFSAERRASMGRQGLQDATPCAGDIVIHGKRSGNWSIPYHEAHQEFVSEEVPRAACRGRAELAARLSPESATTSESQ